jgi:trigger factor
MTITLDKKSTTDGLIKITLTESDYQPKVEEKLKEYSRKASIKGFRAGKVPTGMIKKMYGKSILVEEVNHLVSHKISDYIKENQLAILGEPIPNREKAFGIDWDVQKEFEFEFQIGMVEPFHCELSANVNLTSYVIEVDNTVIDETLTDIKSRFGKVTSPETSEATDNLFGDVTGPDGQTKSSYFEIAHVMPSEQAKFVGLKKEDVFSFNAAHTFKGAAALAKALNISAEEATAASGDYTFKISSISRAEPALMGQELFDQVFGKDSVTTEEAFIEKIKETISGNYSRETEHLLDHEIQHYYVDHTSVNLPDEFLKTWIKATSNGKVTDQVLELEYDQYKSSIKWDLIKNKITEDHKIVVEGPEVREKAKQLIAEQFGGPGIAEQLGDKFDAIADNYLAGQDGKGENFMRLYNQLKNEKIVRAIKNAATITEKKISLEEFEKIVKTHNH